MGGPLNSFSLEVGGSRHVDKKTPFMLSLHPGVKIDTCKQCWGYLLTSQWIYNKDGGGLYSSTFGRFILGKIGDKHQHKPFGL